MLGSSGELTMLSDETATRVAHVAVEQVAGRIPVYAGVGDTGLTRTLARAERLAAAGVDHVVVTPPFYYPVTDGSRLVWYFETIADRVAVPVVLYNIPQNTQVALPPEAVRILAGHPNIVGIKDSAGDPFAFEEFLALRSGGFSVLQGREQLAASSLWSGADGVISAMGNIAPRLLRALVASVRDDRPRAESFELQAAVSRLARVFDQGYWLAGLKTTLQELGWQVGDPSPPTRALRRHATCRRTRHRWRPGCGVAHVPGSPIGLPGRRHACPDARWVPTGRPAGGHGGGGHRGGQWHRPCHRHRLCPGRRRRRVAGPPRGPAQGDEPGSGGRRTACPRATHGA